MISNRLEYFIKQVRLREGEHEQSLLRVFFALPIFIYLLVEYFFVDDTSVGLGVFVFSAVWFATAILIVLYIYFRQNVSRRRQVFTMFADISAVSFGMLLTEEAGVIFYGIYLWVITGNGIRYGRESLITAYVASLLEFTAVLFLNDFWHDHIRFAIGLWLTLCLVPLYILKLRGQLNDALEKANAASKAKSDFLSNMSHEMRTPLNGVIGSSDLLLSTRLDEEQKDLVSTLKKSAHLLLKLIDNILDLSKIESGKLVTDKENFDLHKLVNSTLEMFLPQVEKKGIGLSVRFTPETHFMLFGDALHLQQVMINLVGNAIKFTNTGKVELRISTIKQDTSSTLLRFEIIDTGIGISPQAQSRIFESFTQADKSITRTYGGTGLGTTISKQLIEAMGGTIGLQSEPGIGSIFWFDIPFEKCSTNFAAQVPSLSDLHVLTLGLPANEQEHVENCVQSWGIRCEHHASVTSLFTRMIDSKLKAANIVLLCMPQNLGFTAETFIANIPESGSSRKITSILLNPDLHHFPEKHYLDAGYFCVMRAPIDKPLLFNALHSIVTPRPSEGVISFKEHYERSSLNNRGLRILLAEDNETNRKIIEKILEYGHHKVDMAEHGEQALDLLERNEYDLMILDMNMPLIGGLDVVKIHRALSRTNDIPVIILTANATPEAQKDCEQANINAYLTKPVDALTLLETVSRVTLTPTQETAPKLPKSSPIKVTGYINELTLFHLGQLGGQQKEFLETIIYGYLSESEKILNDMKLVLAENNMQAFKELAHILKGSSGNVGAEKLYEICSEILYLNDKDLLRQAGRLHEEAVTSLPPTRSALLNHIEHASRASL